MTRITNGYNKSKKRKNLLKKFKNLKSIKNNSYILIKEQSKQALQASFNGRKLFKSLIKKTWILRINALVNCFNLTYSKYIYQLKKQNIFLNTKMLSLLSMININFLKSLNINLLI